MARDHTEGVEATPLAPSDNLLTTVMARAAAEPARTSLRHPSGSGWTDVTAGQLAERVRKAAAGLIALGIGKGDRVAIMSSTRIEWTIADLAILAVGGVTVPIYETSSPHQCEWILSDSGTRAAFAGTADHAKTLDAARSAARDLGEILVLEDGALETLAERASDKDREEVERRLATTGPDDVASVIYTSGTTGNPKGCVLTHGNLVATARGSVANLRELFEAPDAATLLFLPLAHVFARVIQFGVLESRSVLGYARSIDTLAEDLASFRPSFLLAVPRIFERVFNRAQRRATGARRRIFDFAVATARDYAKSDRPGLAVKLRRTLSDRLVYTRLRAALGGRLQYCISGGAPLAPHLAEFFIAAGVIVLEGYGLTETSAGTCVNTPDKLKVATVGLPTPGVQIRTAEDGELLVKGPGVFKGYWNNDAATADTIDAEGWFHTGDLGEIDDDGFVRITGRKKELIITAGGKNVAPAVLEERLKAHRLVGQAMVVGDGRPFVGALVTLDEEELTAYAGEHGLDGDKAAWAEHDSVRAEVAKAVEHANQAVSRAESIRNFVILHREWSVDEGEITPSLKVKRAFIAERHAGDIERLYNR
jgi:long-chain acyl-CoA synthetase